MSLPVPHCVTALFACEPATTLFHRAVCSSLRKLCVRHALAKHDTQGKHIGPAGKRDVHLSPAQQFSRTTGTSPTSITPTRPSGKLLPAIPLPAPGSAAPVLPHLVDVAEEPVGRVPGEVGQRPEQLPPPVEQLDGFQQHAGQAEHGGQVQHPGDIHTQPQELHHPGESREPLPPLSPSAPAAPAAAANAGRRGRSRVREAAKSRQRLLGGEGKAGSIPRERFARHRTGWELLPAPSPRRRHRLAPRQDLRLKREGKAVPWDSSSRGLHHIFLPQEVSTLISTHSHPAFLADSSRSPSLCPSRLPAL